DIGGVHGPVSRGINLDTFGLTVGQSYPFVLFFDERHTSGSNFFLQTSIDLATNRQYKYPARAIDPDGDAVTYDLAQAPAGMMINHATGAIVWGPGTADVGPHPVQVPATDGHGGTTTPPDPDGPPHFTSDPAVLAAAGLPYSYPVSATDPDGDPLVFSLVQGPQGMAIDPATGRVVWSPVAADVGAQPVTIRVSDGQGGTADQTFTLVTVETATPNHPPVIVSRPTNTNLLAGRPFAYTAQAVDPDNDPVTYALAQAPTGMTINPTTGAINWPAAAGGLDQWASSVLGYS